MCDLYGFNSNKKIKPLYLDKFSSSGFANPDGWGIGFKHEDRFNVILDIATLSPFNQLWLDCTQKLYNNMVMVHSRMASVGKVSINNCHPFKSDALNHDHNYIFMHNGTLFNYEELSLIHKPIGDTDSERAFLHTLYNLRKYKDCKDVETMFNSFSIINHKGYFNCMMSDGTYLICYNCINGFHPMRYALVEDGSSRSVIVSTYKGLDNNIKWVDMEQGGIVLFKDGLKIYEQGSISRGSVTYEYE